METVVVLGASKNPARYSFQAVNRLRSAGHNVIPVHPAVSEIDGLSVVANLSDIDTPVDTVTLYVNPDRLLSLLDEVIKLKPTRVIMNPGTESSEAQKTLELNGIKVLQACTLVMLSTGQW